MRRLFTYLLVLIIGMLLTFLYIEKTKTRSQHEQTQVILNGIKQVQKMIVTEGSFSEIYSFEDSDKYFFETISFDKKAIVAINAKVEVTYDLSQLDIQVDSIVKTVIVKNIPNAKLTIVPDVKFFDLQQSQFNTFSATELNTIRQKAIAQIKDNARIVQLKENAKERLLENLQNLFILSRAYGWTVKEPMELIENKKQLPLLQ